MRTMIDEAERFSLIAFEHGEEHKFDITLIKGFCQLLKLLDNFYDKFKN